MQIQINVSVLSLLGRMALCRIRQATVFQLLDECCHHLKKSLIQALVEYIWRRLIHTGDSPWWGFPAREEWVRRDDWYRPGNGSCWSGFQLRWNASRQFIVVHQAVDYHHCITYQVHLQQDLQVLHKLDSKKSEFDQRVTTVILGNVKHTNRSAVRIVSSCNEYPNENEKEDELEAYNRSRFPSLPRVDGIWPVKPLFITFLLLRKIRITS